MENNYVFDECFLPQQTLYELAQRLPTPFYLYDETGLRTAAQHIDRAFSWNAGHRQFFPLRLMPNSALLMILRSEGCGVQCGSLAELLQAERCGFRGGEIIFSPMFPSEEELLLSKRLDATLLLDNIPAADFCESMDALPARALLRYNPGGKFTIRQQAIARPERSKLGMTKPEIFALTRRLQAHGVQEIGLETQISKHTLEPDYCAAVAKLLLELAAEVQGQTGVRMCCVNLGGGPGLGFLPEQENPDILDQGERTRLMVQLLYGEDCLPIHTGVGRLLAGPHAILVSRVLCVKQTHRNFVVVDAAVSNFMRALQGAHHHISVVGKTQNAGRIYCDVVGRITTDGRFAERRLLPPLQAGDFLVVHDAGFCGSSMATNYGGIPRCGQYLYTAQGQPQLIAPAQRDEDCLKAW